MPNQWCVVHAKSRSEQKALKNLENQGFKVWLPLLSLEKFEAGQLVIRQEPLFPRYLFIHLDPALDNWSSIKSTRGVSQLLRQGTHLSIVHEACVNALRLSLEKSSTKSLYQEGDHLQVIKGLFKGLVAEFRKIVEIVSGELRAMVLLEILGRQQYLSIDLDQVRLAA